MGDSLEGSFGGLTARINGRETIYLFITVVCLIVVGYMLWHSIEEARQDHKVLQGEIGSMNDTLQEQNYIITLTSEEREQLKLTMPRSLRDKLERH
jgi:hypothetical protein